MPSPQRGGSQRGGEAPPGPRRPEWGCACGTEGNWACRLSCRGCGKAAPPWWRDRAKAKAKEQERAGGNSKEVKELKAELARTRRLLEATQPADTQATPEDGNGSGDAGPSIADLVAARDSMERKFGFEHPITLAAAASLEEARAKREQGKAASTKVRDAERAVERKRKSHETARLAEQESREAHDKSMVILATARTELEAAEQTLRQERAAALEEAGGASADEALRMLASKIQGDDACEKALEKLKQNVAVAAATVGGADDGGVGGQPGQDGTSPSGGTGASGAGMEVDFDNLGEDHKKQFAEATDGADLSTSEGQKRAWEAMQQMLSGAPKRARTGASPPSTQEQSA